MSNVEVETMCDPGTFEYWQKESHDLAKSKGFHDPELKNTVDRMLVNIHGEVSEAWEEARRVDFDPHAVRLTAGGKPEGFGPELADIAIRLLDTAECHGIDLIKEIRRKHAYNKTRPYRHGKRA